MVTVLLMVPIRVISYLILISAVAPALMGSFGHSGMVHPHDPTALVIINGAEPVFLNFKILNPGSFELSTSPKSTTEDSAENSGPILVCAFATKVVPAITKHTARIFVNVFFMMSLNYRL